MLLRVSGEATGVAIDLTGAMNEGDGGGGVPHGALLKAFAEAVHTNDAATIAAARGPVVDAVGEAGAVDAAAVIAIFHTNDRVADATGIPLDPGSDEVREAIAAEIGFQTYSGG